MQNPYLLEFEKYCNKSIDSKSIIEKRLELVRKYSWAIPNQEAINSIIEYSPIIECGAGTGYWASLINQSGGNIIAMDKFPPSLGYNYYLHSNQYYPVSYGDEDSIKEYKDRTLMLCWCPYNNDMGYNHICNYKGNHLILIGEEEGGCCGNDKMFQQIKNQFNLIKLITIPQWDGVHDKLKIYSRKYCY